MLVKTLKYFAYTLAIVAALILTTLAIASKYNKQIPANYLGKHIEKKFGNVNFKAQDIFINFNDINTLEIILNKVKIKKEDNQISIPKASLTVSLFGLISKKSYIKKIIIYQAEAYLNLEQGSNQYIDIINSIENLDIRNSLFSLEKAKIIVNKQNKNCLFGNIALLSAQITKKQAGYLINSDIQGEINDRQIDLAAKIIKIQDELKIKLNFQHFDSDLLIYVAPEIKILEDLHFSSKAEIKSSLDLKEGTRNIKLKESYIKITSAHGNFFNKKYFPTRQEFSGDITTTLLDDTLSIENADLSLGKINILAKGKINIKTIENDINLDISIEDLDTEKIYKYWPLNWSKKTRNWLRSSITNGKINKTSGTVAINNNKIKLADITSAVRGVSIKANNDIKSVEDLEGILHISENDINLEVKKATINEVDLWGSVSIENITSPEVNIKIQGEAKGKAEQAVEIYPKIKETINLNLPNLTKGAVTGADFYFNIPIANLNRTETKLKIQAKDIEIDNIIEDINFAGGALKIDYQDGELRLKGTGMLDEHGIAMEIASNNNITSYAVQGEIAAKYLEKIKILKDINGIVNIDIKGKTEDMSNMLQGTLDITNTAFMINELNISKEQGASGKVDLNLTLKDSDLYIRDLCVDAETLKISHLSGNISAEEYNITLQNLTSANNNFTLIAQKDKTSNLVELYGKIIDLSQLSILRILGEKNVKQRNKILIMLDEAIMKNEVRLDNVKMDVDCMERQCKNGYLQAELNKTFKLQSMYKDGEIKLTTNNAGLLLQALNISDTIKKGDLLFYLNLKEQDKCTGEVVIENFRLTKAPVLAQILSIASFEGLMNTLDRSGIEFKRLFIPFSYKNGVIFTQGSLAEGISLGIVTTGTVNLKKNSTNLKGTVIPFYIINHGIEKIPFVGKIVTGGEGKGFFFGIDYSLIGDINNPLIGANPLTAFAPGFLRKIFKITQ